MHIVIMGCGRVGAGLAIDLTEHGHSVAVVDQNPEAFRRLPETFDGLRVRGVGFDRDTLTQAGIEDAYAFAAVSSGDNSNILAARVARETFEVANVVARIYDPRRAEIYQRLGIPTVGTVRWTVDQIVRRLLPVAPGVEHRDASGQVTLAGLRPHGAWTGATVAALEEATGARVGYLTRLGRGTVATARLVLQENDVVHLLVATDQLAAAQRVLAEPPREEH